MGANVRLILLLVLRALHHVFAVFILACRDVCQNLRKNRLLFFIPTQFNTRSKGDNKMTKSSTKHTTTEKVYKVSHTKNPWQMHEFDMLKRGGLREFGVFFSWHMHVKLVTIKKISFRRNT